MGNFKINNKIVRLSIATRFASTIGLHGSTGIGKLHFKINIMYFHIISDLPNTQLLKKTTSRRGLSILLSTEGFYMLSDELSLRKHTVEVTSLPSLHRTEDMDRMGRRPNPFLTTQLKGLKIKETEVLSVEQGHFPPAMILRYCSALWAAFARAASWLEAKPWHTVMGWVESSTRHWHRPLRLRSSRSR